MLVLTRKITETIHIDNDITITIRRIGPTAVQIGIDAPRRYSIKRGEIYQTDRAEDCLADRITVKTEDN